MAATNGPFEAVELVDVPAVPTVAELDDHRAPVPPVAAGEEAGGDGAVIGPCEVERPELAEPDGTETTHDRLWAPAVPLVLGAGQERLQVLRRPRTALDLEVGPDDAMDDSASLLVGEGVCGHDAPFRQGRRRGRG